MHRAAYRSPARKSLLTTYAESLGAQIDRQRSELALIAARQEAEIANRSKSEFLANMSHELRTPLNAILGFSEIIRDVRFGNEAEQWPRYQDYAKDIHVASSHLLSVVNDILDMSRIEAGHMTLDLDEVMPAQVIESVVTIIAQQARDRQVKLAVDLPEKLPRIEADARRIKQAVLNLAANAVKFTEAGGTVTLGVSYSRATSLVFTVQDTGIGMSDADLAIALQPFHQVDGGLARKEEGTGLGLPLARAFCELHGATFRIASKPGEGTTASIRFPLSRLRGSAMGETPAPTGRAAPDTSNSTDPK